MTRILQRTNVTKTTKADMVYQNEDMVYGSCKNVIIGKDRMTRILQRTNVMEITKQIWFIRMKIWFMDLDLSNMKLTVHWKNTLSNWRYWYHRFKCSLSLSKCSSVLLPPDLCIICTTCNQTNALEQYSNDAKLTCTVVATDPKKRCKQLRLIRYRKINETTMRLINEAQSYVPQITSQQHIECHHCSWWLRNENH